MWPWRRKTTPTPETLPVSRAEWRALAPIGRILPAHPLVNPVQRFTESLASWQNPSYLEPLGHQTGPAGPTGVADLATPVPPPAAMPFAVRPRRPSGGVIARLWSAVAHRDTASSDTASSDLVPQAGPSGADAHDGRPVDLQRTLESGSSRTSESGARASAGDSVHVARLPMTTVPTTVRPIPAAEPVSAMVPVSAAESVSAAVPAAGSVSAMAPVSAGESVSGSASVVESVSGMAPVSATESVSESARAVESVSAAAPVAESVSGMAPVSGTEPISVTDPVAAAHPSVPLPVAASSGTSPGVPEAGEPASTSDRPTVEPASSATDAPKARPELSSAAPVVSRLSTAERPQPLSPLVGTKLTAPTPVELPMLWLPVAPTEADTAADTAQVTAEPGNEPSDLTIVPASWDSDRSETSVAAQRHDMVRAALPDPPAPPHLPLPQPTTPRRLGLGVPIIPAARPEPPAGPPVQLQRTEGVGAGTNQGLFQFPHVGHNPRVPTQNLDTAAQPSPPTPLAMSRLVGTRAPITVNRAAMPEPTRAIETAEPPASAIPPPPATPMQQLPETPPAQREEATVAEPAPAPASGTSSTAPPTPAAAGADPDELVKKLFDPLLRRLKTELRLDRERRGRLTDLRQ